MAATSIAFAPVTSSEAAWLDCERAKEVDAVFDIGQISIAARARLAAAGLRDTIAFNRTHDDAASSADPPRGNCVAVED
jgi:hypothetical protein